MRFAKLKISNLLYFIISIAFSLNAFASGDERHHDEDRDNKCRSTAVVQTKPYIVILGPTDLKQVRVNLDNYQPTNKEIKKYEVNFGDGTVVKNKTDIYHPYTNDQKYLITIKTWDSKNVLTTYTEEVEINSKFVTSVIPNTRILGPISFRDERKYSLNLNDGQAAKLYKLSIVKNSSSNQHGKHRNNKCRRDFNVDINGIDIFKDDEINCSTNLIEKFVRLTKSNRIRFEADESKSGNRFSIEMNAVKLDAPNIDTTVPVLTSNISSGQITKSGVAHISVNELSNVTTYIWDNNQNLLNTITSKEFDLPLAQGRNDFILQSLDASGNRSQYLYLTNIVYDSVSPILSPVLLSEYIYSSYPQTITLVVNSNESLEMLTVNNQNALMMSPNSFQYDILVNGPQTLNLNIKAFDLAGNETILDLNPIFNIDNLAPNISTLIGSNSYLNSNNFEVKVIDNSTITTQVFLNGELILSSSESVLSIPLTPGQNNFLIQSTDAYGNLSSLEINNVVYDNVQPIILGNNPSNYYFNLLPQNLSLLFSSNEKLRSFKINGQEIADSNLQYTYQYAATASGVNTLNIQAIDLAGNEFNSVNSFSVILDSVVPVVTIGATTSLTNQNEVFVSFNIQDDNTTSTIISVNGLEIATVSEKNFSYLINLPIEGQNEIKAISTDIAGNKSTVKSITVNKDTLPPTLSQVSPSNDMLIAKMKFIISGYSNEELSSVVVNGVPLSLSADKKYFSGQYIASQLGINTLLIVAKDLLGNETQLSSTVNITNALLNSQLVSVTPSTDGLYYYITGRAGASRADAAVSANTGIFSTNNGEDIAKTDGSFAIKMSRFSTATVIAKDLITDEEASFNLSFYLPTSISGIIKDYNDNPLPGATVRVVGTSLAVQSNDSGVFTIADPPFGDQTISIDGSTISQPTGASLKKYFTNNIAVSISAGQNNTLGRPVYLVPVDLDGTQVPISSNQPVTVTSPNAVGVSLSLPAGVVRFPSGLANGEISIREIPAIRAAKPVPENAVPDTVYSFQPSGTKFTQRVELTLPNSNNLAPGMETFILSLNSLTGNWEINGIAKVSSDGANITTKPGFGITHFSDMYVVPAKPYFESMQDPTLDGINVSKGAFETSVELPSFKSLGSSMTPMLKYNSSWARPTAFITNGFAIPKQEIKFESNTSEYTSDSKQVPIIPGCFSGDLCPTKQILIEQFVDQKVNIESGFVPDSIASQTWVGQNSFDEQNFILQTTNQNPNDIAGTYISNSLKTDKWTLQNNESGTAIPNFSQISYGLPLRNSSGLWYRTGIYPALTRYELKLKHLTIRTITTQVRVKVENENINFDPTTNGYKVERNIYTHLLNEILPKDIHSKMIVQNKIDSPAGAGWDFDPTQKIINNTSTQLLLDEGLGTLSTYNAGYPIETVLNANGTNYDLSYGAGINNWPNAYLQKYDTDKKGKIFKVNMDTGSESLISTIPNSSGTSGFDNFDKCGDPNFPQTVSKYKFSFTQKPGFSNIIELANGTILGTNTSAHSLYDLTGISSILVGGDYKVAGQFNINQKAPSFSQRYDNNCKLLNLDCYDLENLNTTNACTAPIEFHDESGVLSTSGSYPVTMGPVSGSDWRSYDQNNVLVTSKNKTDGFNKPTGLALSPDGKVAVADTGNNVVLLFNPSTKMTKVIAGNFVATDSGDGGKAAPNVTYDIVQNNFIKDYFVKNILQQIFLEVLKIEKTYAAAINFISNYGQASIYHPKGLTYDSQGNLYITSENGFIRKVDSQGFISTYAGRLLENGGTLADSAHAEIMLLNNPTGVIIDEDRQLMFVADTGNHRILQIDMVTKIASKIAGNDKCEADFKDGESSLNASICSPTWLGFDDQKNLIVIDSEHKRIRRVKIRTIDSTTLTYYPTNVSSFTKIVKNQDGSFIRSERDGSQVFFNASGKEISAVDRIGNTTSFEYSDGKIERIINNSTGQTSTFSYIGDKLESFKDPAGRTTSFNFDGNLLTSIILPDGTQKRFEYDVNNLISKIYDQNNNFAKINYNQIGRLGSIVDPEGKTTVINDLQTLTYQNPKLIGTGTDKVTGGVKNANNIETKFAEDLNGFIVKYKDGNSYISEIKRDLQGRPLKIVPPDGQSISLIYSNDKFKDLIQTKYDYTGLTTSQTVNSYGQITSKTDSAGKTVTYNFAPTTGLLISQVLPSGNSQNYVYNPKGLLISSTSYVGTSQIANQFDYDQYGNKTKTIAPDGKESLFEYDIAGNVKKVTVSTVTSNQSITSYEYDAHNRLKKVISPKSEETQYFYDDNGNLTKIIDPKTNETVFVYDKNNRLINKIGQFGLQYGYSYDNIGNVIEETDPNGNLKKFEYTNSNKIKKAIFSDENINYTYDQMDQLSNIDSSSGIGLFYGRDSNKRITTENLMNISDSNGYSMNYIYDAAGNKTSAVFSSNYFQAAVIPQGYTEVQRILYSYDQDNKLTNISNYYGDNFSYSYDSANRLTALSRPGSKTDYLYNSGSLISQIIHSNLGITKSFSELVYDEKNLPIQKRNPSGTFNYGYDSNGQITNSSNVTNATLNESFTYDQNGNRLTDSQNSFQYFPKIETLKDDGIFTYNYDNNGNVVAKNSKNGDLSYFYQYTTRNQLKQVQIFQFNGVQLAIKKTINYKYDPVGRRISKTVVDAVNSTKSYQRKYAYDGDNVIAEFDSQRRLLAAYTHSPLAPDDILSVYYSNKAVSSSLGGISENEGNSITNAVGKFYFLKDHLGTITDIADGNGNIVQKYDYSVFGIIRSVKNQNGVEVGIENAPMKNSFTYTGREYDSETGNYYYRARYYDAKIGRFLQADPHPGSLDSPLSFNTKYSYVENNPNLFKDPSGKILVVDDVIIAFILIGAAQGYIAGMNAGLTGWNLAGAVLLGATTSAVAPGAAQVWGTWAGIGLGAVAASAYQAGIQVLSYGKVVNQSNVWAAGASSLVGGLAGYAGAVGSNLAGFTDKVASNVDKILGLSLGSVSGPLNVPTPSKYQVETYEYCLGEKGCKRAN